MAKSETHSVKKSAHRKSRRASGNPMFITKKERQDIKDELRGMNNKQLLDDYIETTREVFNEKSDNDGYRSYIRARKKDGMVILTNRLEASMDQPTAMRIKSMFDEVVYICVDEENEKIEGCEDLLRTTQNFMLKNLIEGNVE